MIDRGKENLITKIKLSKTVTLIKASHFKTAIEFLSKIKPVFKETKQYKNAAICSVLLSECALSEGDNEGFTKEYDGAV